MTSFLIPWPDKILSPNARVHWGRKSKATKSYRYSCGTIAMAHKPHLPESGDIALQITFFPPDKRRRDRDNLIASLKAAMDGIADAWEVNDSRFVPTYRVAEPNGSGFVKIEVVA